MVEVWLGTPGITESEDPWPGDPHKGETPWLGTLFPRLGIPLHQALALTLSLRP